MKWRWRLLSPNEARTSRSESQIYAKPRIQTITRKFNPRSLPPSLPPSQESDAMSHVAGYTVAHDVSARDWQLHKNGGQWLIGKTFDTFSPLGPAIVTTSSLSSEHMH